MSKPFTYRSFWLCCHTVIAYVLITTCGYAHINGSQIVQPGQTLTYWVVHCNNHAWTVTGANSYSINDNAVSVTWGCGTSGIVTVVNSGFLCANAGTNVLGVTILQPDLNTDPIVGDDIVCEGDQEDYSIPVVPDADGYNWTVTGGGNIASGQNTNEITVNWTNAGAHAVNVRATSTSCPDGNLVNLPVTVNSAIGNAGTITHNEPGFPNALCGGTVINYQINGVTGAATYEWSAPHGATITGQGDSSITIDYDIYAFAGDITVIPIGICGVGGSNSHYAEVKTIPAPPGEIIGPAVVCEYATSVAYFIDPVPGANNYTWSVTGGTLTVPQGSNRMNIDWGSFG